MSGWTGPPEKIPWRSLRPRGRQLTLQAGNAHARSPAGSTGTRGTAGERRPGPPASRRQARCLRALAERAGDGVRGRVHAELAFRVCERARAACTLRQTPKRYPSPARSRWRHTALGRAWGQPEAIAPSSGRRAKTAMAGSPDQALGTMPGVSSLLRLRAGQRGGSSAAAAVAASARPDRHRA